MKFGSLWSRILTLLIVGLMVPRYLSAQDNVSQRGIAILNRNCVSCHGQTRVSALDLRHRESALKGGNRGPAVVPGNAKMSLLYQAASHSESIENASGPTLLAFAGSGSPAAMD
jgi:cytochrome c